MLYIVPTPIGNLEDITFRAISTLKNVSLILAEDTRTSGKLLKHFEIETQMRSFHAFNEHKVMEGYVDQLLQGMDIALISDAGTPGISDPGYLLIRACVEANVEMTCLPGPTAFVPALVSSGLPCDKFFFEGFLPHKKGRMTRLKYLCELDSTFVLYESPHRLLKCLKELALHCGIERRAAVVREISKLHEESKTDSLEKLILDFESRASIKGEIVLVVQGKNTTGKVKKEKNRSTNKYKN
ncbi:MAG: 16S rRNA (cytidine(1402)-2'-O)-methyltransferase [Saprospiraceae bacterium]|nr:16S rRNA (cytidine(1402)-2'-O)-methyltransferase [Saprospiraceae bacterium]